MRQLFPPPNLNPQSDLEEHSEPVETKRSDDQEKQPIENEIVETKPVETKLSGSMTLHLPLPRETRIHNPHSILYAALPPIVKSAEPVPNMESDTPVAHKAMGSTTV